MRRRDLLVGAGGLAAGSSLIVGSGSFSSVEADRELQVDVVGDEEAYLELHHEHEAEGGKREATVPCGGEVALFDIRNRFSSAIEELEVSVDDHRVDVAIGSDDLDTGHETEVVLQDVSNGCSDEPVDAPVEIEASGDGFSVEATREFEIEVVEPTFECLEVTVEQTGNGNNAGSVTFDYVLNVAAEPTFTVEEDRENNARANTDGPDEKRKEGSETVEPDEGNFRSPIDITASLDPGNNQRCTQWKRSDENEITLAGDPGCSE